jgi:hypothetical protein
MSGMSCGKFDLSRLDANDYISNNNNLWVKADVDEKIYIWDRDNNGSPEPYVVIKFGDACFPKICDENRFTYTAIIALLNAINPDSTQNSKPVDKKTSRDQVAINFCKQLNTAITNKLTKDNGEVDNTSSNAFRFQPAAVMPSSAIIPMKSNIKLYGPYASSNFGNSAGGTNVSVDTDLAPWVFGSIASMNDAGNSIVESANIGLLRAETGSITIPGLPNIANLGAGVGGVGPSLSNISFSFGSSGISTTCSFRTYTPKFGSLNRHFLDKFKNIAKNRNQILKFLRSNQITQNKINRKISKTAAGSGNKEIPSGDRLPQAKRSLQRVMIGEIRFDADEDISPRTKVGLSTLGGSVGEMIYDYDKKAYMSLDGLFGPVSLGGDGGLPRYASFSPEGHKSSPIAPQPPFSVSGDCSNKDWTHEQYNLEITQEYLNPLTNKFDSDEHHHEGGGDGHVIDMVGRETELPEDGIITNFYDLDDNKRYSEDYRFLGMRGPIVLHSWGYDLEGKPIPNEADNDDETKNGIFTKDGLKDRFLKDWLKKPATWPAAPVDLRFDRERGLWVSPQSYRIIVAKIIEKVPAFGRGKGVIVSQDNKQLFDKDGEPINPNSSGNCDCEDGQNPDNPKDPKKTQIDVVVGIELTDNGLTIRRKSIVASSVQDIAPIIIETTNCEPPPDPDPDPDPDIPFCTEFGGKWWYDENADACYSCCSDGEDTGSPKVCSVDDEGIETFGQGTVPARGVELFDSKTACEEANSKGCNNDNFTKYWYDKEQDECFTCCSTEGLSGGGVTDETCFGTSDDGKRSPFPGNSAQFFNSIEECRNNRCEPTTEAIPGMIIIADRIGIPYYVGELVYAYYDTQMEEYIVLGG